MTPPGLSRLRQLNKDRSLGFSIPAGLSAVLYDAGLVGRTFRAELTEDGILFRLTESPEDAPVPKWVVSGKATE